jgi:hypothetical protein
MGATLSRRAVLAAAVPAVLHAAARVRVVDLAGEKVSFLHGKRPLFEYRYSSRRPKTYVHPLYSPNGIPLTLDGPEDHVHHRGLMLAWSDVQGFDFWGETNAGPPHGQIVHQRFETIRDSPLASITEVSHWMGGGETLVVERRTIRAPVPTDDYTWLEWESELRAAGVPLTLSAKDHPYDGLGIRFVRSMDGGAVLNAKGSIEIDRANGEPAAWCAYSGRMEGGGTAGVAIFDHPSNTRHPSPFFVMNKAFGYMSAAPTFRDPFSLRPGETLRLRYAVVSYLGVANRSAIEPLFERWSKQPWNRS